MIPASNTEDEARPASIGGLIAALLIPAGLISAVLMSSYLRGQAAVPAGFDTPYYVWRSNLVASGGLGKLTGLVTTTARTNISRLGFPAFSAVLHGLTGVGAFQLTFVLPTILAIVIGFAGGAFALSVLGEPKWSFPIYASGLGLSAMVVRTSTGPFDNLLVDAIVMAAGVAALRFAHERRGIGAALLLLVAAVLVHWLFAGLFFALLVATAVWLAPPSLRAWRRGEHPSTISGFRLAALLGCAAVAGIAAFWLVTPGLTLDRPVVTVQSVANKMKGIAQRFQLWLFLPVAVSGAVALGRPNRPLRRAGMWFLALWALSVPVAWIIWDVGDRKLPVYRVLDFSLGLALLAIGSLVWVVGRIADRAGRTSAWIAAAVALLVIAVWATSFQQQGVRRSMRPLAVSEVQAAIPYLREEAQRGPIVIVTTDEWSKTNDASTGGSFKFRFDDNTIRAALPADLAAREQTFVGRSADLVAGHATVDSGNPGLSELSTETLRDIGASGEPVTALWMQSTNDPAFDPIPRGPLVAPGVVVIEGPAPATPAPGTLAALSGPSPWRLTGATILILALLILSGSGWAVALIDDGFLVRAALAPALGIAWLVVTAVFAGKAGLGYTTPDCIGLAALVIGSGWAVALRNPLNRRTVGGTR